jgi:hypothetical protein
MVSMTNYDIYLGKTNNVCSYTGYTDNSLPYTFTYATPWLDYGNEFSIKIPKNFYLLIEAGSSLDVSVQWAVDFAETYDSVSKTTSTSDIAYYGVSEYGESEYGYGYAITPMQGTMSRSGKVVKFKVEVPIEGVFNIKKYEIYAKMGRVI